MTRLSYYKHYRALQQLRTAVRRKEHLQPHRPGFGKSQRTHQLTQQKEPTRLFFCSYSVRYYIQTKKNGATGATEASKPLIINKNLVHEGVKMVLLRCYYSATEEFSTIYFGYRQKIFCV